MPKFDFSCPRCETVEERSVKFSEADQIQRCNQCGSDLSKLCHFEDVGVIWNCSGGTRGFGGGKRTPKTPAINPGHREPTLADLGLSNEQGATLGIK